jgi:hypothetical protein
MSNLSELLPAGGAGKNVSFVASGTLPNGTAVILNANGTVEAVSEVAQAGGTGVVFETSTPTYDALCFDPSNVNTFIIAYRDGANSGYGTAVVGTVSGTSLSFGTPVVFVNGDVKYVTASFDSNTANQFVVSYRNQSSTGRLFAVLGTVSGTSISFGSIAYVSSANYGNYPVCAFDPNTANKLIVAFSDAANGYYGTVIVGTVSGTTINFGYAFVFNSGSTSEKQISFDPSTANKFVIIYTDSANSSYGTAVIGTLSGSTASFGSEVVFNSGTTSDLSVACDPNTANKFVATYRDGGNSNYGTAIVGTVSGTSPSFGTEVVFLAATAQAPVVAYNPNVANKFAIVLADLTASKGKLIVGTVSGTSLSFATASIFNNAATDSFFMAMVPSGNGKCVISYPGASAYGTAAVWQLGSTNVSSFIGMADAAIADTAEGSVTIKGGLAKSVSNVAINVPATIGSSAVFLAGNTRKTAFVFDSNANKVICCYKDSGATNYATAIVGTVSGSAITFGTPVVISSNGYANEVRAVFDSNVNKVICVSLIGTSNARASVGTVSGTSISFGSEVTFNGSTTGLGQMAFDSTANKALISYRDDANSDAGTVVVATISGTSISFGAETVFESNQCSYPALIYDANANKTVLAYSHIGDSSKGKARIGTITGTSISFGAAVEFNTSSTSNCWGTFIPSTNKIFLAYTAANHGTGIVGTVSGTSISFGAPTAWETAGSGHVSVTLNSSTSKPIVAYYAAPTFRVVEATISGTSVSFNTPLATSTGSVEDGSCVYDSNSDKVVISYRDTPNSGHGTAAVYTPSSTLSTLVAGTDYYLQGDGSVSTTSTSPAVKLGKALSTTSINLEFNT